MTATETEYVVLYDATGEPVPPGAVVRERTSGVEAAYVGILHPPETSGRSGMLLMDRPAPYSHAFASMYGLYIGTHLTWEIHKHALAHYDDGGWDVVVEAMTAADIIDVIDGATTLEAAIAKDTTLAAVVSVWADRQADARNSAF